MGLEVGGSLLQKEAKSPQYTYRLWVAFVHAYVYMSTTYDCQAITEQVPRLTTLFSLLNERTKLVGINGNPQAVR